MTPLNNFHRKPNLGLGLKGKHHANSEDVLEFCDGRIGERNHPKRDVRFVKQARTWGVSLVSQQVCTN